MFMIAWKCAAKSTYGPVDIWDFMDQPTLLPSMIVDHWLSYLVAITLSLVAYTSGYLNRLTGSPWEFHMIFAAWLLGHCAHELYWFTQFGNRAAKVPAWKVGKGVVSGPLAELDYYLDIQFICIALLFGSKLAYLAMFVFIVSNILGQLILFTGVALGTFSKPNSMPANDRSVRRKRNAVNMFKVRGFDVLQEVVLCNIDQSELDMLDNLRLRETIFLTIKFFGEDVLQAMIQSLFVHWYVGTPIVYLSIVVSLSLSLYGFLSACCSLQATEKALSTWKWLCNCP